MADADRLVAALRYQQELEDASRPATVNPLMARKAEAIKQNAPAENMLTQYAETMPQNWQQFGQNMAQAYPTPATGASREQILGAVTQAAVNAGPLMTVYHGSPHRFDKFDASKIGTGEGAQAYGHGLYLAENPDVAKGYQDALQTTDTLLNGKKVFPIDPNFSAASSISANGYDTALAMARRGATEQFLTPEGRAHSAALAKQIEALKGAKIKNAPSGNLYKVDLPDEQIAKMLDWDKPLSQQADLGKKISPESLGLTYKQLENGNHAFVNSEGKVLGNLQKNGSKESFTQNWIENVLRGSGRDLYNQLGQGMGGGAKVSEALQQAGIPGIRYLDQGSRAAPSSAQFAKTDVVGAADDLTALAKSMGLNAEVRHSGSNAGKSSYVSVFDPMTNRYIKSSFRISDHGTGPLRHQEHIHINSPADLATQKNDLFEWVKRNRTEKGVDTTGLSAPSQGTSNFVVFDPKHMNIIGRE